MELRHQLCRVATEPRGKGWIDGNQLKMLITRRQTGFAIKKKCFENAAAIEKISNKASRWLNSFHVKDMNCLLADPFKFQDCLKS